MFKYVKYKEAADKKHVRNAFTGEVVGETFTEWWKCILMLCGASGEIYDECANDARRRMRLAWNVRWVPENLQFDIYPNDSALLTGLPEWKWMTDHHVFLKLRRAKQISIWCEIVPLWHSFNRGLKRCKRILYTNLPQLVDWRLLRRAVWFLQLWFHKS